MPPPASRPLTILAMGGHSLMDPSLPPTVENQFAVTARAVVPVADLLQRGERLVITHGNGPQVGFMQIRSELAAPSIHEVPLDSLVADTQGALGYMIERALREELEGRGLSIPVATVVTEVEVDPDLPPPTKPVGPGCSEQEAAAHRRRHPERVYRLDGRRGWRRVVPSPAPRRIVQLEAIRAMLREGLVPIACGGGGIPVARGRDGRLRGVEAVIDKDRTSALLGARLGARRLVITTSVDAVYQGFLSGNPRPLRRAGLERLRALSAAGEFPPGSMGPKIAAAIAFIEAGGREVLICEPLAIARGLDGRAGTLIVCEEEE